tara:strand:+ start:88 stop:678 length:591 start_codon:yes stop_codon:yes gene_type:complete
LKKAKQNLLVLASSSENREKILSRLNVPYKIFKPKVDEESIIKKYAPRIVVKKLSLLKALKAKEKYKGSFILSADTIVYSRRKILNKTYDEKEALSNIKWLSGRRHRVYTGMTFISNENRIHYSITQTKVQFKNLSIQEMQRYILTREWEGCAGSYAIQGYAEAFVKLLVGSYSNVVGLPLNKVHNLLEKYKLYNA